jgi:hypothetical protein
MSVGIDRSISLHGNMSQELETKFLLQKKQITQSYLPIVLIVVYSVYSESVHLSVLIEELEWHCGSEQTLSFYPYWVHFL